MKAEEVVRVVDWVVCGMKWRMRLSSKRRLQTDILALCTRLRPVILVDYGGKMPELKEQISMFLQCAQKESCVFLSLQVMVIEDMIYMIHVHELAEYISSTLELQQKLHFISLEQDPPKIILQSEQNTLVEEVASIQKLFSTMFPPEKVHTTPSLTSSLLKIDPLYKGGEFSSGCEHADVRSLDPIDLSSCLRDLHITTPTLNGWLLGYPVVYLFDKDHCTDAMRNLSTKSLHLYKIIICRNQVSDKKAFEEELMSFTVPFDLSSQGKEEPWAEAFLSQMMAKFERCKHAWAYLRLEVTACDPQTIVF